MKAILRNRRTRYLRRIGLKLIRFGDPRETTPLSLDFGFHHGEPIDHHEVARFLEKNRDVIRGGVLKVGDLTAASCLDGLSSPELPGRELEKVDLEFVMLVTARAQRPYA